MKQYRMWFILLLIFTIGCGNSQTIDEEQPIGTLKLTEIPKQEEIAEEEESSKQNERGEQIYTSAYLGNIDDIAITEDGYLYVTCFQKLREGYQEVNGKELLVIEQPSQYLYGFDLNGECVCEGQMIFSSGETMVLEWEDGVLYMVIPGMNKMSVLYQVTHLSEVYSEEAETYKKIKEKIWETNEDINNYVQEILAFKNLDMWNLQELYRFDMFSEINRLVFMGDKLYVHGVLANPEENPFMQNIESLENDMQSYQGQAIGYLDRKNLDAGVTLLPVDGIPQDMIKLTEDTLGVYLAGKEEICFWKYIPAKETWEQTDIAVVKLGGTAVSYSEFAAYEDGCFYVKDGKAVCYKPVNGTEVELFESDGSVQGLKTDGTFLYYYSNEWSEKEVRRVEISELLGKYK